MCEAVGPLVVFGPVPGQGRAGREHALRCELVGDLDVEAGDLVCKAGDEFVSPSGQPPLPRAGQPQPGVGRCPVDVPLVRWGAGPSLCFGRPDREAPGFVDRAVQAGWLRGEPQGVAVGRRQITQVLAPVQNPRHRLG